MTIEGFYYFGAVMVIFLLLQDGTFKNILSSVMFLFNNIISPSLFLMEICYEIFFFDYNRAAASFLRTCTSSNLVSTSELGSDKMQHQGLGTTEDKPMDMINAEQGRNLDLRIGFGDWLGFPWLKKGEKLPSLADKRCHFLHAF